MKIFVFGPSCAGKSTLSKGLHQHLGKDWIYLDRDKLIDQQEATDETANDLIDKKILNLTCNFILDIQIPWREKRIDEVYILVFAPLPKLLERDDQRTKDLNRSSIKTNYARSYVIKTYELLIDSEGKPKAGSDYSIDTSLVSIEEEMKLVQEVIQKHLQKIKH